MPNEPKRPDLTMEELRARIAAAGITIPENRLAMVRKLIILDLATTDPLHLFALSAAMAALGGVYWTVRDQDRRERPSPG